jgi:hypothetical protein
MKMNRADTSRPLHKMWGVKSCMILSAKFQHNKNGCIKEENAQ